MTVATQGSKVNYQGNGITTEFQVPFPFLEEKDIYIQKQLEDTTVVNLTYGTDYSVTGAGNASGGTVVLTTAPSASEVISVYRSVPLTQEVDYRENEIFPAETHEEALDKLTMEVQQLQEQADRAIRISRFSDADPETVVTQVERIYDSIDNVDIVADNISDITTVGNNISSVVNVSDISTQVSTVASNADTIKTIADNIDAVIKSPEYANNSKTWAEGEDTAVVELGGTHSSKVWAAQSESHAVEANTAATQSESHANASESSATASAQSATVSAQSAALAQDWATKTDGMVDGAEYSAKHYANKAGGSATASAQSATNSANSAQSAQDALDTVHGLIAFPIGTIMQAIYIDESLNIARRLNGQVIIQSQFVAFTNKVKAAIALFPSLSTTETNWQAEKTNSRLGQCGKFVVDDTAGTIRLPAVVNAQGLADLALLGNLVNESLPNITGSFSMPKGEGNANGAFYKIQTGEINADNVNQNGWLVGFDASRSSSTYQDGAPVQQEAVQYPYYIVVNTGVEEAERPINNYQVNNVYSYGMSQYYKGTMNNNSWLRSQGQWNDGAVYTGMYNWLLEQMNAGVSGFVASTGEYTDYDFVINTADQTFRLPILNGEESWVGNTLSSLSTSDIVAGTPFTWTATKNGFVMFTCYNKQTQVALCYINGQIVFHGGVAVPAGNVTPRPSFCVKVKKDDIVSIGAETETLTNVGIRFIPAVGNGSLYYYVGDTLQNADLINVARIEEKIVDLSARRYVTETWKSGTLWYRIWSDGWVEQGGVLTNRTENATTFNLLVPYNNTNFTGTAGVCTAAAMNNGYANSIYGINSIAPVSGSQACTRTVSWSDTSWAAWGYRS